MTHVIYEMGVSADGYIYGPDGTFDWSEPDDELHQFHNDRVRELGAHLLGRRLYETMLYWETADDPSPISRDFGQVWKALPKLVFSRTLDAVQGTNTTLARRDLATELAALKAQVEGDIGIGGAGLAADAARLGLIDEYRVFVHPVAVGGGIPFFPRDHRLDLELVDTRTFGSRIVHMRYRVAGR